MVDVTKLSDYELYKLSAEEAEVEKWILIRMGEAAQETLDIVRQLQAEIDSLRQQVLSLQQTVQTRPQSLLERGLEALDGKTGDSLESQDRST